MTTFDIEVYNTRPPYHWNAYRGGCSVAFAEGTSRTKFGLWLSVWAFTLRQRRRDRRAVR